MTQEILDAPKSVVKIYNPIEEGISLMLEKHGHVLHTPPAVTDNPEALAQAKEGHKELAKFRARLEGARKEAKAESLAYGRLVDSEAARIQAIATPLELAYAAPIEAEENRLEAIREAEIEAERQRIAGHRARIQGIKDVRETGAMCRTADRLKQLIDGMPARLAEPFEEFQAEAEAAHNETLTMLHQLHAAKVEAEAQAADLKRQQDELARQRTEQAARDLADRQARAAEEVAAQAKRKAEEAEFAKRKADFEAQQQQARAAQEAQAAALAAQQAEIEAQKAALAAPVVKVAPVAEPVQAIEAPAPAPAPEVEAVPAKTESLPEAAAPSAQQLVQAVAETFGVTMREARGWLVERAVEIEITIL